LAFEALRLGVLRVVRRFVAALPRLAAVLEADDRFGAAFVVVRFGAAFVVVLFVVVRLVAVLLVAVLLVATRFAAVPLAGVLLVVALSAENLDRVAAVVLRFCPAALFRVAGFVAMGTLHLVRGPSTDATYRVPPMATS